MERTYSRELLDAVSRKQTTVVERGLPILVKPIPDDDRPGVMDPRTYAAMAPMLKGLRGVLAGFVMRRIGQARRIDPKRLRRMFDGIKSIPIAQGVATRRITVPNGTHGVPVRVYAPERPAPGLQPVLCYFHGGGWAAGSPDVVEEMCRLVVDRTGCVAFNVDYRLVPEHPYPAGFDDCYATVRWIGEHASEFGGDGGRICVSGDSAGGNYAAACALRDRDERGGRVRRLALLYPSLDMARVEDEEYHFSRDEYEIHPDHAKPIGLMLDVMDGKGGKGGLASLLGDVDVLDPYVSPYLADLRDFPPCLLLYGEHDFLRVECEAFARKLRKADREVRCIRYRGLGHGFADMVGVCPQAEDALEEIGRFLMETPIDPA